MIDKLFYAIFFFNRIVFGIVCIINFYRGDFSNKSLMMMGWLFVFIVLGMELANKMERAERKDKVNKPVEKESLESVMEKCIRVKSE